MKENFEKVKNFVKENKTEIAIGTVILASGSMGYILGRAVNGITWKQIETLMGLGAQVAIDSAKINGLEAAEKLIKLG